MRSLLAAWLPALLLVACTSVPVLPSLPSATPASRWTLAGRIGIQSEAQSLSGNLRWQHRPDFDELLLASPLGQGVARIERTYNGVMLDVPGEALRMAPDAEALTRDALGYALPLAGLVWWVQALPDPARPFEANRDASGRLERLKQDGWTIDYLQYVDTRPRKLTLNREGLEIRLVADEWQAE
ncbi:MAG: lipoprotein insertase outer membrane protein LolB [Pseudomonadota bacterium]